MDRNDTIPFLLGSLFTALASAAIVVAAVAAAKADTLESACGACEQKGKLCGEYVCTQHGWE